MPDTEHNLKVQALLVGLGYNLGATGPNHDGVDGKWGPATDTAMNAAIAATGYHFVTPTVGAVTHLTNAQIKAIAEAHGYTFAQVAAVREVESSGGFFSDVRGAILDLDGPGGFIDGHELPKILFEAKWFHKFTGGRYDASHPRISSRVWDRSLYIGGQSEYGRLWEAMKLDREAALKSASWGMFQIMGFNHAASGYASVEGFVAAMKESEAKQLEAFLNFVKSSGLSDELKGLPATATAFAIGYNGAGQAKNNYSGKIVAAYNKWKGVTP
jgi:hypothetical protein